MSELRTELSEMGLGERISCGDMEIMRTVNGWLWTQHFEHNSTTTFEPDLGIPPGAFKKKSPILVAH